MQSRKVFRKGLPLHGLSSCRQILFSVFYPVAPKQFRNTLCKCATRSRPTPPNPPYLSAIAVGAHSGVGTDLRGDPESGRLPQVTVRYGVPEWPGDFDFSPGTLRAWCEIESVVSLDETDRWIVAHCKSPHKAA